MLMRDEDNVIVHDSLVMCDEGMSDYKKIIRTEYKLG